MQSIITVWSQLIDRLALNEFRNWEKNGEYDNVYEVASFIKLLILRKRGKKRAEVDVYFVTCWWNARPMFRYKTNICRTLHMIYFKPCSFLELSKPFSYRIVSQERSFRTHSWKRLWLLIFNIAFRCLKSVKKLKFLKITPHSNTIHSIHHKSNLFISFSNPNQFTS